MLRSSTNMTHWGHQNHNLQVSLILVVQMAASMMTALHVAGRVPKAGGRSNQWHPGQLDSIPHSLTSTSAFTLGIHVLDTWWSHLWYRMLGSLMFVWLREEWACSSYHRGCKIEWGQDRTRSRTKAWVSAGVIRVGKEDNDKLLGYLITKSNHGRLFS